MNIYSITMIATMLVCIVIMAIAIIRLRLCEGKGGRKARLKYTLIVSSALMGIGQPVFFYAWPGLTALCLSMMFLVALISGVPPLKAYKDSNEFFDTALYDPTLHGDEL